jgi:hypothetical protein
MVKIVPTGKDSVIAYGSKPSVGGQSQRAIFNEHQGYDCIVHFHAPKRPNSKVEVRPQWMFECGSHECGHNTSTGLGQVGEGIKAVFLDQHGPNIVFNSQVSAEKIINFIDENFDLSQKTGGPVEVKYMTYSSPASSNFSTLAGIGDVPA